MPDQAPYIEEAVRGLVRVAPEHWSQLTFTVSSTVDYSSQFLEVLLSDGSTTAAFAPITVTDAMDDLRHAMHVPGRGTWFTATLTVDRSSSHSIEFDYDSEPEFVPPPSPASFALDQEHFPRDDDHLPEWLRAKLAEAGDQAEPE
ncbi:hypothetical protein E1281_23045 [Actinomadura sp. KC345]|uniref:hypothetical protein n=1 Tax=Actinomadura sp. KC345 TaxID=2530371 RepID=UPI00104B31FF|nr:hypothetical protein [Actinomadura sp. KC345]TDC49680.1 hypothetical protein E1281_23045 [Actinomadura sp. KC345]